MNVVRQVGPLWLTRNWRSFVTAAATIAVCLGLAFFAIAGARRTQSAYPRFLQGVRSSTELAVLTALGFTRKQRAATLMWHSTVVVALGLLIGVPLGAIIGRELWNVFAERLDVLAPSVTPGRVSAIITVGAFVLAVVVSLEPASAARRMNVSAALRDQ